jgi:hypothetical protein
MDSWVIRTRFGGLDPLFQKNPLVESKNLYFVDVPRFHGAGGGAVKDNNIRANIYGETIYPRVFVHATLPADYDEDIFIQQFAQEKVYLKNVWRRQTKIWGN